MSEPNLFNREIVRTIGYTTPDLQVGSIFYQLYSTDPLIKHVEYAINIYSTYLIFDFPKFLADYKTEFENDLVEIEFKLVSRQNKWGTIVLKQTGTHNAYIHLITKPDDVGQTWWMFNIATTDEETGILIEHALLNSLPAGKHNVSEKPDTTVHMRFWMLGSNGPIVRTRPINIYNWKDIRPNYVENVADKLDNIMSANVVDEAGGKLLLFHGEPGTGKSTLLLSLTNEWKNWCTVSYITDPERFFGDANYLMSLLLDKENSSDTVMEWVNSISDKTANQYKKWRLLIVEDADEFIRSDAKLRSGQALSRFLNTTDGILGQGLDLMVLLTTNEPLANLHPAVTREGRCIAQVEFQPFSTAEAKQWLLDHECEPDLIKTGEKYSLSKLFELKNNARLANVNGTKPETVGTYL